MNDWVKYLIAFFIGVFTSVAVKGALGKVPGASKIPGV
jgi:hypothetical protein